MRASIAVVLLYAASRAYAAVIAPWTTPVVQPAPFTDAPRATVEIPSDAVLVAQRHLPHAAWAVDAKVRMRRGENEGFVYFNELRRIEDDRQNRVRFTPFALVWIDPKQPEAAPYTVTCDSAVVEFSEKFDPRLGHSGGNRMIGGQFIGEVQIAGPNGLLLRGKSFWLSEGQRGRGHLSSEFEITFAYGPSADQRTSVRGRADRFDLRLMTGDDSLLGQDLPRIGGVERIVLLENVSVELVVDDDGRLLPISLQSDNRFEYDVENMLAEFNENVRVAMPTHEEGDPEQFDRLHCDRLALSFEPKPPAHNGMVEHTESPDGIQLAGATSSAAKPRHSLDLDLQLRTLTALGREVILSSEKNELHGQMGELFYDVGSRTIQMLRDEQSEHAEVRYGSFVLICPEIRLLHDEHDQGVLRGAWCEGAGQVLALNAESGEMDLEAGWSERLTLSEESGTAWNRLDLLGEAYVIHPQQQMGVVGDRLQVWFDRSELESSRQEVTGRPEGSVSPLRRVLAEQTGDTPVWMVSPDLRLKSRRVQADFSTASRRHPLAASSRDPVMFGGRRAGGQERTPIAVTAGDVQASITIDPVTNRPDVTELTASTDVRIDRSPPVGDKEAAPGSIEGPFSVECET
ncbi:MAG: hypothetical protein KF861_16055, partial [Planctomycetaceae bacterium]|nr:hypothetical protein [Planctomycetaceae bacterium]